jgi:hypothetical protein
MNSDFWNYGLTDDNKVTINKSKIYNTGGIGIVGNMVTPVTSSTTPIFHINNSNIIVKNKHGKDIEITVDMVEKMVILLEVIENLPPNNELKNLFLLTQAMKKLGAE